jgi:hypothetical protein
VAGKRQITFSGIKLMVSELKPSAAVKITLKTGEIIRGIIISIGFHSLVIQPCDLEDKPVGEQRTVLDKEWIKGIDE